MSELGENPQQLNVLHVETQKQHEHEHENCLYLIHQRGIDPLIDSIKNNLK